MATDGEAFRLDPQLAADCHLLGRIGSTHLLLMDNSSVPWFILVPETDVTEFHELSLDHQRRLLDQINALSLFLKTHFGADKINLGAIGNKVRQLHIHVIGRFESDTYWPGVVWGATPGAAYETQAVESLRGALKAEVPLFDPDGT